MGEDTSADVQNSLPAYAAHWEADVVLRDGSTMRIRPIRPEDADALSRFHEGQSPESTYFRFFAPLERLPQRDVERFTRVDHRDRVALVLVRGDDIVAVGRFDRLDASDAEVAFNVSDAEQGKGLGSVLLEHLAAAARELGVRRFVADVLPTNVRMIRVFTDAGYDVHQDYDDGVISLSFTIRPTDRSLAVLAEREQRAEASSMARVLHPESVLLFCEGSEGETIGARLLADITSDAFAGTLTVVGLPGHPATLEELPEPAGPIDLALVAATPAVVRAALPRFAALGVQGVVLYTGGFATWPRPGRIPQRSLVRAMREHGMRLVGPRSFGVIAGGTAGHLNATLWPYPSRQGSVGLFCQSGAAGHMLLAGAHERGLGISTFLSAGHRVDVSGNDTMQSWSTDENTRVACLRLESIGNPRKFSRVARRLSEQGPVIAMIAGTTGQLNPPGHAVRTTREPHRALGELMRQAGVVRVGSVDRMLDLAALFSEQPLPRGDRVLVLTNSGTQAAVVSELVQYEGLKVAQHATALRPTARPADFAAACAGAAERDDWDVALVSYVPMIHDHTAEVAAVIARFAQATGRTTLAAVHGLRGLAPELTAPAAPDASAASAALGDRASAVVRVPGFRTVDDAARALGAAHRYATWRTSDHGTRVDPPGIARRQAKDLVQAELAGLPPGTTRRLSRERASALLAAYGMQVWGETTVTNAADAVAAAEQIGWPVVLKTTDELLRHRADLGGVRVDLSTPEELQDAFAQIDARIHTLLGHGASVDVQAMAPTGVACVVRAVEDDLYGPIVNVGLAGDAVELLGDVSYRVPPLTDTDATDMLRSLKASARLFGHRGLPRMDVAALEDVIARLSVLKDELAEVSSVILNPVLVSEQGLAVLSAAVEVAHPGRGDAARRVLPG